MCAAQPTKLDTSHAIAELTAIVKFVEENPCAPQAALLAALAGDDKTKAADVRAHLTWLIEKGYVVAYANGALTAPAEHPVYQPPKGGGGGRAGARPSQEEKPAAEKVPAPAAEEAPAPAAEELPAPAAEEPPAPAPEEVSVVEEKKEEVKQDETAAQLAE